MSLQECTHFEVIKGSSLRPGDSMLVGAKKSSRSNSGVPELVPMPIVPCLLKWGAFCRGMNPVQLSDVSEYTIETVHDLLKFIQSRIGVSLTPLFVPRRDKKEQKNTQSRIALIYQKYKDSTERALALVHNPYVRPSRIMQSFISRHRITVNKHGGIAQNISWHICSWIILQWILNAPVLEIKQEMEDWYLTDQRINREVYLNNTDFFGTLVTNNELAALIPLLWRHTNS